MEWTAAPVTKHKFAVWTMPSNEPPTHFVVVDPLHGDDEASTQSLHNLVRGTVSYQIVCFYRSFV